jgi:hypothetical protein
VNLFWTVPLTLPVPGEEAFSKAVFWIHFALAVTMVGVILVHVAGALQHHFFRRDATLIRMLPEKRQRATAISPPRLTLAAPRASDAQSIASSETSDRHIRGVDEPRPRDRAGSGRHPGLVNLLRSEDMEHRLAGGQRIIRDDAAMAAASSSKLEQRDSQSVSRQRPRLLLKTGNPWRRLASNPLQPKQRNAEDERRKNARAAACRSTGFSWLRRKVLGLFRDDTTHGRESD